MKIARRWLAFMLILVLLLPSVIYADPIPPKDGLVQDTAGMIPKESLDSIEQAAQGSLYTFYFLTINSLDGENPADYASSVYEAWQLTADDVIVLLSKNDRRVEMNFNNPALQAKIDALPEDYNGDGSSKSKLSEFVDHHFIPSAKEGRFADGAIALMNATNELKAPAGSVSPVTPTPSPVTPSKPEGNTPKSETQTPPASNKPSNPGSSAAVNPISNSQPIHIPWSTILIVLAALLVVATAGFFFWSKIRHQRLQKRIPGIMADLNRSSERNRPYASLYQGITLQTAEAIDREINELLVTLKAVLDQLQQIGSVQYFRRSVYTQLKQTIVQLKDYEAKTASIMQRVIVIEETEKHVSSGLITEKSDLRQVQSTLTQEQTSRKWSLGKLEERSKQLAQEFQAIDDLDAFDPLQADTRFIEAQAAHDRLEQDVAAVPRFAEAYRQFPNEAAAQRNRFEAIVQEHSLKLVHIDPYSRIEEARATMERMFIVLQDGDIPEAERLSERSGQQLADAVQMVQRLADLKLKNAADIDRAAGKLTGYPEEDQQLRVLTDRVRHLYRTKHWEAQWQDYLGILHVLPTAARQLKQVRTWSEVEVQEYELARTALDEIFHHLQERDKRAQVYSELVHSLDQQLEESKRRFTAGDKALRSGGSIISRNQLVRQWNQLEQQLQQLNNSIMSMLNEPPYDVDLLLELSSRFVQDAEAYLQDVERTAALKQSAESKIHDLERKYQSTYSRTRSKVNASRYNRDYSNVQNQVRNLMSQGRYEDAAYQAGALAGIISAMNSAYEHVIAEERREEAARRAEEQRRSMNNSSSGSSWGNNSNSSGGSSWSNNNNNSSGGSNW
ncbi:TPM domain-containing protein [Paenibacillus marinisediminis]